MAMTVATNESYANVPANAAQLLRELMAAWQRTEVTLAFNRSA